MYGIINKSLKEMMLGQYGEARWERALERSRVAADSFLSMRSYDDEVTYRLATAAAEELGINLEDTLRAFGVHWVEHTLKTQYDTLATATGQDLVTFLRNLDHLHDRISSTFLDYRPPAFSVDTCDDDTVVVMYRSQRTGFTPFVEGLLQGFGARFNQRVEVLSMESLPVPNGEQTRFHLKLDQVLPG